MFTILRPREMQTKTTLGFHLTSAWPTSIKQRAARAAKDVGKEETYSLLVGVKTLTATIEISVEVAQKAEN